MLTRVKSLVRKVLDPTSAQADAYYRKHDYLTAYALHTDLRVEQDPRAAIGGHWQEMGLMQFGFLVANGLGPASTLLDYGCGTLRGGRYFIGFLDAGHYTGVDLSSKAIAFGCGLIADLGLEAKRPDLVRNETPDRPFACVAGRRFDFILAQSVITHLPDDITDRLLRDVVGVMKGSSTFFFTYNDGKRYGKRGRKGFVYPSSYFAAHAARLGCRLVDRSGEYPHPDGQRMLSMRLGAATEPAVHRAVTGPAVAGPVVIGPVVIGSADPASTGLLGVAGR